MGCFVSVHMQDDLIAVTGRSTVEICRQGRLRQQSECICPALSGCDFLAEGRSRWGPRSPSEEMVCGRLERSLHDRADLGSEPAPNHDHAIVVHPRGQMSPQVLCVGQVPGLRAVPSPPRTHKPLHLRGSAGD